MTPKRIASGFSVDLETATTIDESPARASTVREIGAALDIGIRLTAAVLALLVFAGCASTRTYHPMTGKVETEVSTFFRQADLVVTYDDVQSTGWRRTVEIHHEPISPSMAGVLIVLGATLGSAAGPGGAAGGGLLGGALGMVLDALGGGDRATSTPVEPTPAAGPPPAPEAHRSTPAPPLRPDETGSLPTSPALVLSRPLGPGYALCGGLLQASWCP